jgi:SPP1 gp7 family putative phage head morphogenesis protein
LRSTLSIIVRAVHSNVGVSAWYRQQLDGLLQEAHADLSARIQLAFLETPPLAVFGEDAARRRSPTTNIRRALRKWGIDWEARFDKMSADIAKRFASRAFTATEASVAAAFKQAGWTVEFKPTAAVKEAYAAVIQENVGLIKSIPRKYLTDVQSNVWQSVMRGSDMATLAKQLQKNYHVTARRAAFIARDQNSKARAVAENVRRKELGIQRALWQHSRAGAEPRESHLKMDGKPFDIDKGMWDSAVQRWVWPGTEINCRCSSRSIIPTT